MIMLSFRVEDREAARIEAWAARLGIDRSELIRRAIDRHLSALASGEDIEAWSRQPMTASESALAEIAEWGPAEDWSDWGDAAR